MNDFINSLSDKEGRDCPCCGRYAQLYKRRINYCMADSLIRLYLISKRNLEREFFHTKEFTNGHDGRDFSVCKHWDLIEAMLKDEGHNGRTSGYWKITERGKRFTLGELRLSVIYLYNDSVIKYGSEDFDIFESIKHYFDYGKLMAGET